MGKCLKLLLCASFNFQSKPDPQELPRLFTLISENFMSLHYSILGEKHKDEAFIVSVPQGIYVHICSVYIHAAGCIAASSRLSG